MEMNQHFESIAAGDILAVAEREHAAHSRFVQVLCINGEDGIDLVYSYQGVAAEGYPVRNYRVSGITPDTHVPSVTKYYLSAFPFENEAHDLFGVNVDGIAIDFHGNFYKVAMDKPMTVISPAQKAAREKAAKLAAAKAAKEAKAKAAAQESAAAPEVDWAAERAKVEAKCANLDVDKAAKVMAAFEAKMKKAQAQAAKPAAAAIDWEAERAKVQAKCANLPEDKAAKVMAAFEAKAKAAADAAAKKGGE